MMFFTSTLPAGFSFLLLSEAQFWYGRLCLCLCLCLSQVSSFTNLYLYLCFRDCAANDTAGH